MGKWSISWGASFFLLIQYLTDYKDYDEDYLAQLYNKVRFHGILNNFMIARIIMT